MINSRKRDFSVRSMYVHVWIFFIFFVCCWNIALLFWYMKLLWSMKWVWRHVEHLEQIIPFWEFSRMIWKRWDFFFSSSLQECNLWIRLFTNRNRKTWIFFTCTNFRLHDAQRCYEDLRYPTHLFKLIYDFLSYMRDW